MYSAVWWERQKDEQWRLLITFVLIPTTGSGRTWLVTAYIKGILSLPQVTKDFHKSPGQLNDFVSIVPLGTSYLFFSSWSHTNAISGVLKRHGEINGFTVLPLQPVIAFHPQDAQNYRSQCMQSLKLHLESVPAFQQKWDFSYYFPLSVQGEKARGKDKITSPFPEL